MKPRAIKPSPLRLMNDLLHIIKALQRNVVAGKGSKKALNFCIQVAGDCKRVRIPGGSLFSN